MTTSRKPADLTASLVAVKGQATPSADARGRQLEATPAPPSANPARVDPPKADPPPADPRVQSPIVQPPILLEDLERLRLELRQARDREREALERESQAQAREKESHDRELRLLSLLGTEQESRQTLERQLLAGLNSKPNPWQSILLGTLLAGTCGIGFYLYQRDFRSVTVATTPPTAQNNKVAERREPPGLPPSQAAVSAVEGATHLPEKALVTPQTVKDVAGDLQAKSVAPAPGTAPAPAPSSATVPAPLPAPVPAPVPAPTSSTALALAPAPAPAASSVAGGASLPSPPPIAGTVPALGSAPATKPAPVAEAPTATAAQVAKPAPGMMTAKTQEPGPGSNRAPQTSGTTPLPPGHSKVVSPDPQASQTPKPPAPQAAGTPPTTSPTLPPPESPPSSTSTKQSWWSWLWGSN